MRALNPIAIALGALFAAMGLVGVAAPLALLEVGRSLQTPGALYAVASLRIAFGAVLLYVASVSRMPKTLRFIGTVVLIAGLLTPLFGVERVQAVLTWWTGQGRLFMRASASLAVIFGVFIIYVLVSPRRTGENLR